MKFKFTCKICKKTGAQLTSTTTPFVHAYWYTDRKGLDHGLLYCRSCGAVHDTIGSLSGVIKRLLGRLPSDIVAVYKFPALKKLLRTNSPYFITPTRLPRVVVEAMIEDGRLSEDEDLIDTSLQVGS